MKYRGISDAITNKLWRAFQKAPLQTRHAARCHGNAEVDVLARRYEHSPQQGSGCLWASHTTSKMELAILEEYK